MAVDRKILKPSVVPIEQHQNHNIAPTSLSNNHHTTQIPTTLPFQLPNHSPPIMKVSQIVALSATLIFQAQACVRVRVDRRISQKDQSALIQDVKLYDNDNPVVTLPRPINFSLNDEDTDLDLGSGYKITLRYDRNGPTPDHPYGGTITYPKGRKSASLAVPLI